MKDPNYISTIHLKLPFKDHMNLKVEAWGVGKSMNQYIVDILSERPNHQFKIRPPAPDLRLDATKSNIPAHSIPQSTPVQEGKFPPSAASMLEK